MKTLGAGEAEQREGMFRGSSRESEADRRRSPAGVLCFRPRALQDPGSATSCLYSARSPHGNR